MENLSALLELGEKSLNEGDYLKLANFLKGLRDSQPPNPTPYQTNTVHIETTVEFETLKGGSMRVCVHKMRIERFHGAPHMIKTVWGSINGNELELSLEQFQNKLVAIYNIYGIKNIKRFLSLCEPITFETLWNFREFMTLHQQHDNDPDNQPDDDSAGWPTLFVIQALFALN